MTRVGVLRAGYASLALAFAALAGSAAVGSLVIVAFVLAFVGAVLLVFSDDDVPRWSGVALLVFVVILVATFLLQSSITTKGYHIDAASPTLAKATFDTLTLLSPVIITGAVLAACWERETPVRVLLLGGLGGLLLASVLTYLLNAPPNCTGDPSVVQTCLQTYADAHQGTTNLLLALGAVSALAAAIGAGWAAARPEEYA